jgi:hypothetical protein
MNQNSSLRDNPKFVSWVLTGNTVDLPMRPFCDGTSGTKLDKRQAQSGFVGGRACTRWLPRSAALKIAPDLPERCIVRRLWFDPSWVGRRACHILVGSGAPVQHASHETLGEFESQHRQELSSGSINVQKLGCSSAAEGVKSWGFGREPSAVARIDDDHPGWANLTKRALKHAVQVIPIREIADNDEIAV